MSIQPTNLSQINGGPFFLNYANVVSTIIDIRQGPSIGQRIGRQILITSVSLRYYWTPSTVDTTPNVNRFILFVDKQCNGAPATAAMILTSNTPTSYLNPFNRDRFELLYDETYQSSFCMLNTAVNKWQTSPGFVSLVVPLQLTVNFSGPTNSITDIRSNNLGVLLLTNSSTSSVGCQFSAQIEYCDR